MRCLLLFLLFLKCFEVCAQWEQVFPIAATAPSEVAVAGDSTAYILFSSFGSASSLFKSRDGAKTWKQVMSAPGQMSRIFFLDSLTGFATAGNSVYKTTDGAATWKGVALPASVFVAAIQFTSANIGYLATSAHGVLKTTDGGKNWNTLPGSPSKTLPHSNLPMSFFNDDIGYVVTESGLFGTADGGDTWKAITKQNVINVYAATEDVVYVSTIYETAKSADRGQNWTIHYYSNSIPVVPSGNKGLLFLNYSTIVQHDSQNSNFNAVYHSNFTFSWHKISRSGNLILAIGSDQSIVKSQDGGNTWLLINSVPQHGDFRDIHFLDDKKGLINAPYRGFLGTDNNGASWHYIESSLRNDMYQIAFCHPDTGIVVLTNNFALTTHDGAETFGMGSWTPPIVGHESSKDYEMVTSKIIYTTGSHGQIAKSVDGGTNWERTVLDFSNTLYSIDCLNRDTCYAAGAVGKIVSTWNGGKTWTDHKSIQINQDLVEMYMLNSSVGFASGNNVIVRTSDGGQKWTVINIHGGAVRSFMFTSADTGYAITQWGYVLKTTNQGETWTTVYSPQPFSVDVRKAILRDSVILAITPSIVYRMHLSAVNSEPDPITAVERDEEMATIYPNPTDGPVYIEVSESIVNIALHDARGKLVKRIAGQNEPLEIYDLPPGVYIIHVQGRNRSWVEKIIKK